MAAGQYDTFLKACDGDVRRVVRNHVLLRGGPTPEGWQWLVGHLDPLPVEELVEILPRCRATSSPRGAEADVLRAIVARCPTAESGQRSYTTALANAADRLDPEVWDEIVRSLQGVLTLDCWQGLLGHCKLFSTKVYEQLRKTLPRWSSMRGGGLLGNPGEVREGGPEHPAATLFSDRRDDVALDQGFVRLVQSDDIAVRAHVLANLEKAGLLGCIQPKDALPANYRFASETRDDPHGSRGFFVNFAWRWAKAGEAGAREWFYQQVVERARRAGSWDVIQFELGPWVQKPEDREQLEQMAIERGVPALWIHPEVWDTLFDYAAAGPATRYRYRWLIDQAHNVEKGLPPDPTGTRRSAYDLVPFLLQFLPLPEAPDIAFDQQFVEAVFGVVGRNAKVPPELVIERLATLPRTKVRANLLVALACDHPGLFARTEIGPILAEVDPVAPTRLSGVLQLDGERREAGLRNLGPLATDALGSRLDGQTWTASELRKAADGLVADGATPTDATKAVLNRLPQVGGEDPHIGELLDWLEQHGVVGKALFAAALGFAARRESAFADSIGPWLMLRLRSPNAWKEHGTALFAATADTNGMLLHDILRGVLVRWTQAADDPAKVLGAIKMAFGRLLVHEVREALAVGRGSDVRDLLLTLGTLAAPQGLSKSVDALRHCTGVTGEVADLVDACVEVIRRARPEDEDVDDLWRALNEYQSVVRRRTDRTEGARDRP